MRHPHWTNDKGSIAALRLFTVAILTLLFEVMIPPGVYCNSHFLIMTVVKQSDMAAAAASVAKPVVKTSRPTKCHLVQTGQQILCPRGNSKSSQESNTNSHIASINLNRDRFKTVLMTLSGTSPSKNITPPDLLMDPADKLGSLLPPQLTKFNEPTVKTPQDPGHNTVQINKTPASKLQSKPPCKGQDHSPTPPQE
jgi:hypothetical protein